MTYEAQFKRELFWRSLWKNLLEGAHQNEPLYRLGMIQNQTGSLNKAVTYRILYPHLEDGLNVEVKIALADLLAMTRMMIANEGLDFFEIEELAQKRLSEFITMRLPK